MRNLTAAVRAVAPSKLTRRIGLLVVLAAVFFSVGAGAAQVDVIVQLFNIPSVDVIDARDAVFTSLRLWRDADHDGVSQPSELFPLPALGVARLHLDYKESKRVDEFGNRFRYRAKVTDARGARVNRRAWDVFLTRAPQEAAARKRADFGARGAVLQSRPPARLLFKS